MALQSSARSGTSPKPSRPLRPPVTHRAGAAFQTEFFRMGGRSYYSLVKGDNLVEFFALDSTKLGHEAGGRGSAEEAEQLRWLDA